MIRFKHLAPMDALFLGSAAGAVAILDVLRDQAKKRQALSPHEDPRREAGDRFGADVEDFVAGSLSLFADDGLDDK